MAARISEREKLFELMRRYCRIGCLLPGREDTSWVDDVDRRQEVVLVLREAAKVEAEIWALLGKARKQ